MPGILPMKVIKVGTNAQTRIAQACDRCRSKKIRCDGIRPCCSQCANVGFECKTSDKLSRRAFPRGYTESLEERVRGLEAEVRELKELLDEKDEKIDMLSRIHSHSSQPIHQLPSPRRTSTTSADSRDGKEDAAAKQDVFKVQQSPYLLDADGTNSYFAGTSSSRTFIESFKHKVQETGRSTADIDTERLLAARKKPPSDTPATPSDPVTFKSPPRLVSDQLINVFFQEWAPLFPVVHRPTFLELYGKYTVDADSITERAEIAQLNLIFGIATLSSGTTSSTDLESFETQWKAAIDTILKDNSMATLQALVLAQLYCAQIGDLSGLLTYKGLATTLSARLGLHQSQKRFALGTLTAETRKKVFWTLYTVDCFTSVVLGLPKHLKDEDIDCEYPVDADDEYVSERGFQPTLPGESTKLSSALALFRAARILSKVLEEVFPAKASYELTLKKLADLSDELDGWSSSLPPHLHLQFAQDKPSTGTISSRSPLLSLTYHFVRALIQRPAICASLGTKSSSHMITLASSCKHMIQIVQLLQERGLCFSFCLNRDEILVLSGFGLLFQGLNLNPTSKILKDNSKMVSAVVDILDKSAAPCASEFRRIAGSFLSIEPVQRPPPRTSKVPALSRHNSADSVPSMPTAPSLPSSTKKQLKAIASRFTASSAGRKLCMDLSDHRRATVHNVSLHPHGAPSQSVPSLQPSSSSTYSPASISRSEPARSPVTMYSRPSSTAQRPSVPPLPPPQHPSKQRPTPRVPPRVTNLDYLSFGNDADADVETTPAPRSTSTTNHAHALPVKPEPGPTDWEKLLGSLDNGHQSLYDGIYGGCHATVDGLLDLPPGALGLTTHHHHPTTTSSLSVSDVAWDPDVWALCPTDSHTSVTSGFATGSSAAGGGGSGGGAGGGGGTGHAASILSFSTDDGLNSSSDDFSHTDWVSVGSGSGNGGGVAAAAAAEDCVDATKTATSSSSSAAAPGILRGIVMPADLSTGQEGLGLFGSDGAGWDGALSL